MSLHGFTHIASYIYYQDRCRLENAENNIESDFKKILTVLAVKLYMQNLQEKLINHIIKKIQVSGSIALRVFI